MNSLLLRTFALKSLVAIILMSAHIGISQPLIVELEKITATSTQMKFRVLVSTEHPNMKLGALASSINWEAAGTLSTMNDITGSFALSPQFKGLNTPIYGINPDIKRDWNNQTNSGPHNAVRLSTKPLEFGVFTINTKGAFMYPVAFQANAFPTGGKNATPALSSLVFLDDAQSSSAYTVSNGLLVFMPYTRGEFVMDSPIFSSSEPAVIDAFPKGNDNLVNWSLNTSALSGQYHMVERSANGVDNWSEVGRVAATTPAIAEQNYSLFDKEPLLVSYYRIKTLDNDNKYHYSKVAKVERESGVFSIVNVFPRPTNGKLTLQINLPAFANLMVSVTDVNGRLVQYSDMEIEKGLSDIQIDLTRFAAGTYYIKVDNGHEQLTEQVVKQ